ncbi:MAG: hypothetical protein L0K86_18375 [Actinomycetia bacterium]|nr:hypothetical protein [Actinomycetes bacterium]
MTRQAPLEPETTRAVIPIDTFTTVAISCIVAGGFIAAVTGPLDLEHGSWLAAYLVLVGGVATAAIGVAQQHLPAAPPDPAQVRLELLCLCLGNAAVILGTLVTSPLLVDAGGIILGVGLAIAFVLVRGAPDHRRLTIAYRCLLGFVVVSIPVGLVLAHMRA